MIRELYREFRYALRAARRNLGLSTIVVLTFALGIGASTAIFTIVHALLLSKPPFDNPGQVVQIENPGSVGLNLFSRAEFMEAQKSIRSLESVACYWTQGVNVSGVAEPQRLIAALSSAQFFDVLGVRAILGRTFEPNEDATGKDRVAVISYRLWQDMLDGDARVIGRAIALDGSPFTVVGVLPRNVNYPPGSDIWTPTTFDLNEHSLGAFAPTAIARLRPDAEIGRARSELALHQRTRDVSQMAIIVPIARELTAAIRPALLLLVAGVILVLLIACANVANLMLARAIDQRSEIAIRTVLGASPSRLVRQQAVYSVVLALAGGMLGMLVAFWSVTALYAVRPASLEFFSKPPIEWPVMAFCALLAFGAGSLCGILPAWLSVTRDPVAGLEGGATHRTRSSARARKILIVVEVGLAFALLTGASLLVRTLQNLNRVKMGFGTKNVLSVSVSLRGPQYEDDGAVRRFYGSVLARLAQLPYVRSVGATNYLPLGREMDMGQGIVPDHDPSRAALGVSRVVSSDYFKALSVPVIEGRSFTELDSPTSERVAILNQTLAVKLWPHGDALGRRVNVASGASLGHEYTVVGVVASDRHWGPRSPTFPEYFLAMSQQSWPTMSIVISSDVDPMFLLPSVQGVIRSFDNSQPLFDVQTMDQRLLRAQSLERFEFACIGAFAALAVLLSTIGLFGVISHTVAKRTREIGVRMACGAEPRDILVLVMKDAVVLSCLGLAVGLPAALWLSRLLRTVLFGVSPTDPLTFILVALVFLVTAAIASYYPAYRASRIDPLIALHYE